MQCDQCIDIRVIDLPTQKIVEVLRAKVTLSQVAIHIEMEFYYDEKNENTEVWEEGQYNSVDYFILKTHIRAVNKYFSRKTDKWIVELERPGNEDFAFYNNSEKEAEALRQQIWEWLIA